jgi:chorismate synthase
MGEPLTALAGGLFGAACTPGLHRSIRSLTNTAVPWHLPLTTVAVTAVIGASAPRSPLVLAVGMTLGLAGVVLGYVDAAQRWLPDVVLLPTAIAVGGLLLADAAIHSDGAALLRGAMAATVWLACYAGLAVAGGMGFGDVKLAGLVGLGHHHCGQCDRCQPRCRAVASRAAASRPPRDHRFRPADAGGRAGGVPAAVSPPCRTHWRRQPRRAVAATGTISGCGIRRRRLGLAKPAADHHDRLAGVLRWMTAGESHGPALVAIIDGLPAGVRVTSEDVVTELARRRLGYGRGARMKFEKDVVELIGGVRHGQTIGSPVAIRVANSEWPKWEKVMAADPVAAAELEGLARNAALTRPRPGHADLAGMQKYGHHDARPVLERASARETAARVAVGTVAKAFLSQALGIQIVSHVVSMGPVAISPGLAPTPADRQTVDDDPLRCIDPQASAAMVAEVDAAKNDADTLGGVVEVLAYQVPPGLGSHVQWDRKLDARLALALMSIQAIKGVEIGDAFTQARSRGSAAHDEMTPTDHGVKRLTDRAGGLEGGMTTGEPLRLRAAMKPISSLTRPLSTVDVATGEAAEAINQRSDVAAVAAAAVVAESMVAFVLAEAALDKFGGDSVTETARNLAGYTDNLVIR